MHSKNSSDPSGLELRLRQHLLANQAKIKAGRTALPRGVRARSSPKFPRMVCELEWIWSAAEGMIIAFYLEAAREQNILWLRSGSAGLEDAPWQPIASMEKINAARAECAMLLLSAALRYLEAADAVGCFYSVCGAGILGPDEVRQIGGTVWTLGPLFRKPGGNTPV